MKNQSNTMSRLVSKSATQLLLGLVLGSFPQSSFAANLCANCYWETSCGSVSTEEVVRLGLVNENPGISPRDRGPFLQFFCDNGRTQLGVLWTDGDCSTTGGLSGLPANQFPIAGKQECKFGN